MQKRGATCIQTAARWRHCAHTLPRAVSIENLGNDTQPQAVIGDVSSAEAFDTAGLGTPHQRCVSYSRSWTKPPTYTTFTHAMFAARFHLISLPLTASAAALIDRTRSAESAC